MYKIICPECNSEVDSTNKSCPNCGYPFIEKESKNIYKILSIIESVIIVAFIVTFVLVGIPKANNDPSELDEVNQEEIEKTSDDFDTEVGIDSKDELLVEDSVSEDRDDGEEQIIDDIKGSINNPYVIGEKISIKNVCYNEEIYDIDIIFTSYSESHNLISVYAEISNCSSGVPIYPFYLVDGLVVEYVDSNYSILGFASESKDKADFDVLTHNNLGLYNGGQGETYLHSYDEDEWNGIAEYAVIGADNNDGNGSYYWVKLH